MKTNSVFKFRKFCIYHSGYISIAHCSEAQQKLVALEEAAKAASKGKWAPDEEASSHVRDVKWNVEQPRHLLDSLKGKANEGNPL